LNDPVNEPVNDELAPVNCIDDAPVTAVPLSVKLETTNLLSVNIGTEEQPKWVYTIQPNITFDTSFAQTKKSKATTTVTSTSTTNTKANIEKRRQNETNDKVEEIVNNSIIYQILFLLINQPT
jgi:hypothetical protein